ncbi:MAG: PAS domain S-box protein [Chloroflexi bacterium]|nr:PAS domain S-box protein [Chloroflexota bacterium]
MIDRVESDNQHELEDTPEIQSHLTAWRNRALYVLLLVVTVAGLPAFASPILNAVQTNATTPLLWIYLAVYLALVGLAVVPRLDLSVRGWGAILLAYTSAIASFARVGLAGSGRLYLVLLPVVATMLIGLRAGYLAAGLSLAIYVAFAALAQAGVLANWITVADNPLNLGFWLEAGAALAVFLIVVIALLNSFYRLFIRTLTAQQQASRQLAQTARMLREREERLALVIAGTDDGVWDWDLKTDAVYFSPRWKSMLGYADHEIANRFEEWRRLIHPEDVGRAITAVQTYLEGRTPVYELEHRLQHKDGSYRWILARGTALRDAKGKPYRMAGTHTDITERKRADEVLRQSEKRFAQVFHANPIAISISSFDGGVYVDVNEAWQKLYGYARAEVIGKTALELGRWAQAEQREQFMRQLQATGSVRDFERLARTKSGQIRDVLVSAEVIELNNERYVLSLTQDITERKRAEQALQVSYQTLEQRVEERTRELSAISIENARLYRAEQDRHAESERRREVAEGMRDILKILNSNRPLSEILDYIVNQASRLLNSDAGLISRFEREGQSPVCEASSGLPPEIVELCGGFVNLTRSIPALMAGQPVGIADLPSYLQAELANPGAALSADDREQYQMLARFYQSLLAVPLTIKGATYGSLLLYDQNRREFSEEDLRVGMAFADQIALAIENAQLRDQIKQAAANSERSRLARELHDSVTQSLYSMTLYAEAASRLLTNGKTVEAGDHLREMRDTAQEALREMRLLIFELRPLALEKSGLAAALQARLDAVEIRGGIQAKLEVLGTDRLSTMVEQELYHIAQEALNNTLKHAHAHNVHIRLEFGAAETRLELCDDGMGFTLVNLYQGGGLGLRGMKERAQKIGGQLEIESDANGTRITVLVIGSD